MVRIGTRSHIPSCATMCKIIAFGYSALHRVTSLCMHIRTTNPYNNLRRLKYQSFACDSLPARDWRVADNSAQWWCTHTPHPHANALGRVDLLDAHNADGICLRRWRPQASCVSFASETVWHLSWWLLHSTPKLGINHEHSHNHCDC